MARSKIFSHLNCARKRVCATVHASTVHTIHFYNSNSKFSFILHERFTTNTFVHFIQNHFPKDGVTPSLNLTVSMSDVQNIVQRLVSVEHIVYWPRRFGGQFWVIKLATPVINLMVLSRILRQGRCCCCRTLFQRWNLWNKRNALCITGDAQYITNVARCITSAT